MRLRKRRTNEKQRWSKLPVSVVVNIAFMILDGADLFNFLEALRPYNRLGPLEHLYQFGPEEDDYADFWPALKLNASIIDSPSWSSYKAILKYYSNVVVDDISDIDWIKQHVDPKANIEWIFQTPLLGKRLQDWMSLRITKLAICSECETPWQDVLPQLQDLTALYVFKEIDIVDLFAFAASSARLTKLRINYGRLVVTVSDLLHLVQWFDRQPVVEFTMSGGRWGGIHGVIKQDFYQAMFNCLTMDALYLLSCDLRDLDFSNLTFSMRKLQICHCKLQPTFLRALSRKLAHSRLTDLSLHSFNLESVSGMKSLLQVLPRTGIKRLWLDCRAVKDEIWCELFPLFEMCTLEILELSIAFSTAVVTALARAIQNNHTICELDLKFGHIAIDDLRLLVQGFAHPDRMVKTKRIKWSQTFLRKRDHAALKS
ncbi:hypothetical protein LEN26_017662 [Aphanomyces euteiches]|nr:hypothetical protein LEN26_017662 [Aphanomyces euteiches]KAH9188161.1 hypothetical protein AeNC1_009866 [Aphanomyces euteiches]